MALAADRLPRLLAGLQHAQSSDLWLHRSVYGEVASELAGSQLIDELARADLHGHGGAWFPTARKLAAVAAAAAGHAGRANVVVTITEGESLSGKDSLLARRLPHLLLDGALAVAGALGAERVVLAHADNRPKLGSALARAISERSELNASGAPRVTVEAVGHRYISGQETALISALNARNRRSGEIGLPRVTPPYPFERGLGRRPTFVSNAETYAQIGLIASHGAGWFRAIGTRSAPGSRLVSVTGAVGRRAVIEVAGGSSLASVVGAAGGCSEHPAGVLLGGFGGTWVAADAEHRLPDLVLDEPSLRAAGLTLGPGIVFLLGRSACPVAEVAAVVRMMAGESARQCGPCVHGLGALAAELSRFCRVGDSRGGGSTERLLTLCGLVERRGACAHPDGVARFVRSALVAFAEEFATHERVGGCDRCGGESSLLGASESRADHRTSGARFGSTVRPPVGVGSADAVGESWS